MLRSPISQHEAFSLERIPGAARGLLEREDLPLYYKFRCNMILSAADDGNDLQEMLAATKYYLKRAQEALDEMCRTYVAT